MTYYTPKKTFNQKDQIQDDSEHSPKLDLLFSDPLKIEKSNCLLSNAPSDPEVPSSTEFVNGNKSRIREDGRQLRSHHTEREKDERGSLELEVNRQEPVGEDLNTDFSRSQFRQLVALCGHSSQAKQAHCCLSLVYCFGILYLTITSTVLYFNQTTMENHQYGQEESDLTCISYSLSYMAQNLNADPIMNITLRGLDSPCPDAYDRLSFGDWPVFDKICHCETSEGSHYQEGSCDSSHSQCKTIYNNPSKVDLHNWANSVWCVNRAKPNADYVKAATCPEGFRSCAVNTCVNVILDCPITSIHIDNKTNNSTDQRYLARKVLTIKREIGASPLINIKVTKDTHQLLGDTWTSYGPPCQSYILEDAFSFEIDNQTQYEFRTENHFPGGAFLFPQNTESLKSSSIQLFGRSRMESEKGGICSSLDTFQKITQMSSAVHYLDVIFAPLIITMIVISAIFGLITLMILLSEALEPSNRPDDPNIECFSFMEGCQSCIFILITLTTVSTLYFTSPLVGATELCNQLIVHDCYPEVIKHALEDAHWILEPYEILLRRYMTELLVVCIVLFCLITLLNKMRRMKV